MPVLVNLRHLKNKNVRLEGEVPPGELDLDLRDDLIRANEPLRYKLEAQLIEHSLLVRGRLDWTLDCQCVRCLKPFKFKLVLRDFAVHLPLAGEDAATVVNDSVDLTPHLREDSLLEFPQHPLCKSGCRGLSLKKTGKTKSSGVAGTKKDSSAWAELDKLKF